MTEPMATAETILEPDLPIVDPHHHLWDRRSAVVDPGAPVGHPFEYVARLSPLYLLDQNPTAENIARVIYEQSTMLKLPVPIVEVKLWETPKCFATYRPD